MTTRLQSKDAFDLEQLNNILARLEDEDLLGP